MRRRWLLGGMVGYEAPVGTEAGCIVDHHHSFIIRELLRALVRLRVLLLVQLALFARG